MCESDRVGKQDGREWIAIFRFGLFSLDKIYVRGYGDSK